MRLTPRWPVAALVGLGWLVALAPTPAPAQGLFPGFGRAGRDQPQAFSNNNGGGFLGGFGGPMRNQQPGFRQQPGFAQQPGFMQQPTYSQQPVYDPNAQGYAPQQPAQPESLVPHPQYPGYFYYPSNPAQLYTYPAQTQPAAPSEPAAAAPAQPHPAPAATAAAPPAPAITVNIRNADSSGLAINYSVEGTEYSTPSGFIQKLDVAQKSQIVFDRGDDFGEARYSLDAGTYNFQVTDRGWELYKQKVQDPVPAAAASAHAPVGGRNPFPSRSGSAVPPAPVPPASRATR